MEMLVEYLTGENGNTEGQLSTSSISRLLIVGDSLAPVIPVVAETALSFDERKAVRAYFFCLPRFTHPYEYRRDDTVMTLQISHLTLYYPCLRL